MKLFISPHNDDETLFGAFTILREQPVVLIALDSHKQAGSSWQTRRLESQAAMKILGASETRFLSECDDIDLPILHASLKAKFTAIQDTEKPTLVYAPAYEYGGNIHHNLIAQIAEVVFPKIRLRSYMTYTTQGKSTSTNRIIVEPGWVEKKLEALLCYRSQMSRVDNAEHFLRSQFEYYEVL